MSAWTDQIWDAVERRGIARRDFRNVQRCAGWFRNDGITELVTEAQRRRYHVVKMGNQVVVFKDAIQVLC